MNQKLRCRLTPREDGFVLIGAVIFVLALTILGLSLFSLSGYEAQFLGQTANEGKAFYYATGGIERAKFALISQGTLESVKSNLPRDGVVYARARNTASGDTTGNINFSSPTPIAIRVLAMHNGERCMVQTLFQPRPTPEYYRRLATSFTHLGVNSALLLTHGPQTFLSGEVWQNDGVAYTNSWASPPVGSSPTYVQAPLVIPHPDVQSLIDAHWATATNIPQGSLTSKYDLNLGLPKRVKFYKTEDNGLPFSLYDNGPGTAPEINVNGYAVWMVKKGIRFSYMVEVKGSPNDCLIILCAGDGLFQGSYLSSIWFAAGLNSDKVPVILVANGRVEIEEDLNQPGGTTRVNYLSIFAGDISVIGSAFPSWKMYLTHNPNDPNDATNRLIDDISNQGGLPNASAKAQLDPVRGQWAQLDPDNPPQN